MRLKRLPTGETAAEVRPLLEAMYARRGNVPNMFRAVAQRPEILRTMLAHFNAVMADGAVATRLKELLAVRVSQINACHY
ncbi:MAG: carboxymuconolactone decarboxylase family protein [Terriglobales bacterium]